MTPSHAKAMVLASFAGDALALGAHWIYDTGQLEQRFGRMERYRAPLPDSYHPQKKKGDFTHYGDQTLVLLRSLATTGGFSRERFASDWQALFAAGYPGYVDKATTATLDNLSQGKPLGECGSSSTDLGGPARMAPLVFVYRDNLEGLLAAVRDQTAFTHNSSASLAGAAFLARSAHAILQGASPVDAMESALAQGVDDLDLDLRVRMGLDSIGKDTPRVIKQFGQMCAIPAALPGAIHLIGTYETDLREALIENVMAGGDSAARGMVVGMILGASLGMQALPEAWLEDMTHFEDISGLLDQLEKG